MGDENILGEDKREELNKYIPPLPTPSFPSFTPLLG
jgi:hypothetical protein